MPDLYDSEQANTAQKTANNIGQAYDVWQIESPAASQAYIDTEMSNVI